MRRQSPLRKARAAALLALIPGLIGLGFLYWPVTSNWEAQSLDSLFKLRGELPQPADVCVVAIDEDSRWIRNVESTLWPRDLHGELVRILAREGARAVAFDVLFDAQGTPKETEAFLDGLVEAGNVILGSTIDQIDDPKFKQTRLVEPYGPLAEAAAAVGKVDLPEDRDGVIRHTWLYHDDRPSLALAAYEVATGDRSLRDGGARLIAYYGKPRRVPTVSAYQALEPEEYLAPGYFKDKIVFVGASEIAAVDSTEEKDSFRTPFFGGEVGPTWGVEIHANIAANLLEGRRIDILGPVPEALMLLLLPLLATFTFIYLRPVFGAFALIAFELLPWTAGYLAFTRAELWIPVLIPSLVQLPIAYVVSLVWYYLTTARERERIRRAFAFYLSPDMIRRVTESPDELDLGGEEIVGTAMFTDIKGFTSIAEGMTAPETAALLNDYFSEATSHVFESGGTLIKYIGDAVFAIWGAPLRMDDHATPACRAAVGMSRLQQQIGDRPAGKLVTRIGVHTGSMLVGNLGSSQRFDYTAIGDTINLAARLEGINKKFGTQALVSGEALAATDGSLIARPLGHIRVVGRGEPVAIHELLGISGETTRPNARAIERFERALEDFVASRFGEAADGFREVRELCGGDDGPSEFYLRTIDRLVAEPHPEGWNGVITFETK